MLSIVLLPHHTSAFVSFICSECFQRGVGGKKGCIKSHGTLRLYQGPGTVDIVIVRRWVGDDTTGRLTQRTQAKGYEDDFGRSLERSGFDVDTREGR